MSRSDPPNTAPPPGRPPPGGESHGGVPVPPVPPVLVLLVATVAVSWSGPLVRLADAPPVAVAFWRLVFSMAFIAVVLLARRDLVGGRRLRRMDWILAGLAGTFLALHFWTWFASVRLTSIASAVVLVSTHPFWIAGLSALALSEAPRRREWLGMAVALAGVVVIGWGDFALGLRSLLGDGLALLSAVLVAAYFTIGRSLRVRLDLWGYVAIVYTAAAGVLALIVVLRPNVPFTGFPLSDWLVFLALAAGPMMLGHTGINFAIRYMPAYVANLVILGEAVVATLIAWLLPGIREVPSIRTLLGGAVVLLGIAIGTLRVRARSPD